MSKDRFDIWYNKWLSQVDEEVDESLWEDIEDELDFQETWKNISSRLDKKMPYGLPVAKKRYYIKEIIGIAAGILLILATAKYISDQTRQVSVRSDNISLNNTYIKHKINDIAADASRKTIAGGVETGLLNETRYLPDLPVQRDYEPHMIESVPISSGIRIPEWADLVEQQSLTGYAGYIEMPEMALTDHSRYLKDSRFSDDKPFEDNGINLIGFQDVGMVFGYKNTWLLNHETYNGLNPSRLNNTLPTYRQEIGVATTMVLRSGISFGMEFFWRSEIGQKYQQYINASYVDRHINLDYLKFQAFYILDPNRVPGELLFGGYYSILKSGRETQGGTNFNIKPNYSNSDYGLLLGYQLQMDIHKRITLKPGLRLNYNMRNIFEGDNIVPSHLKKTHSFSAGFNISASYKIF